MLLKKLLVLLLLLASSMLRLSVPLLLWVVFAFLDGEEGEEECGGEKAEGEETARFCRPFPFSPLPADARPTATVKVGESCDIHAIETAALACFLPLVREAEGGEAGEAAEVLRRWVSGEGGRGGGREAVEEGEDLAMLR